MIDDALIDEFINAIVRMKKVHMIMDGVTHKEYFALLILSKSGPCKNNTKEMNVSDLASYMKISLPQASRMLKALEEKNYIQRVVDKNNRRNTFVTLTEAGRIKHKEIASHMHEYMVNIIQKMGADNMRQFVSMINQLTDAMEDINMKKI